MKGNSKRTSRDSLSLLGAQNRDLSAASRMVLTMVKLRLQCRQGVWQRDFFFTMHEYVVLGLLFPANLLYSAYLL